MNLIQRLRALFNPTVDSVVSDLTRMVNKLDVLTQSKLAESDRLHAQADATRAAALAASTEATRAERIAAKFTDLTA